MKRTLPSHIAMLVPAPRSRRADRPPLPSSALTSGLGSLSLRVPVNVPCRKRPAIQLAQRSPATFLPSFHSLTPLLSLRPFTAFLPASATYWRLTVTARFWPSPLSGSPVIRGVLGEIGR